MLLVPNPGRNFPSWIFIQTYSKWPYNKHKNESPHLMYFNIKQKNNVLPEEIKWCTGFPDGTKRTWSGAHTMDRKNEPQRVSTLPSWPLYSWHSELLAWGKVGNAYLRSGLGKHLSPRLDCILNHSKIHCASLRKRVYCLWTSISSSWERSQQSLTQGVTLRTKSDVFKNI